MNRRLGVGDPVSVAVPGKLFIAGEYAITSPGNTAIIAAVDRYLRVQIRPATSEHGTISSPQFPHDLTWFYDADARPTVEPAVGVARLALEAMGVATAYLQGAGVVQRQEKLPVFQVAITSELDDPATGTKYGLGSSGALVVALIRAITQFFGVNLTNLQVYQLAMITSVQSGSGGSGGDIAASSFGGIVFYRSPDRQWLQTQLAAGTEGGAPQIIAGLLESAWPQLEIQYVPQRDFAQGFVVGWTSHPVSTEAAIRFDRSANPDYYANFIAHSNVLVARIALAMQQDHYFALHSALSGARVLLADLAASFGLSIETPQLTALCDAVVERGGVAKPSGAGGGDCGIGFLPPSAECGELVNHWKEIGITPLPVQISPEIPDTLG